MSAEETLPALPQLIPIPLPLPQETSVLIARITFPGKVGRVIPGRKQQAAFEGLSVIHRFTVSAVGWRWG